MGRVDNWESILISQIETCSNKMFRWGSHDCASFAIKTAEMISGQKFDVPRWKTKAEAMALLEEKSIDEWADIAWEPIDKNYVRRGDIVATMTNGEMALGIYVSPTGAFTAKNGICYVPFESLIKAWRV